MIDKAKIKSDFVSCFTPGKILAFLALTIVAGVFFFFLRKTPAKAALDKIPGTPV